MAAVKAVRALAGQRDGECGMRVVMGLFVAELQGDVRRAIGAEGMADLSGPRFFPVDEAAVTRKCVVFFLL